MHFMGLNNELHHWSMIVVFYLFIIYFIFYKHIGSDLY